MGGILCMVMKPDEDAEWRFFNLRKQINRYSWWKEDWGLLPGWQWIIFIIAALGVNILTYVM